jgi:hypothetical protein
MESVAVELDVGELCKQLAINDNELRDRSARGLRGRKANLRSFFDLRTKRVVTRVHDRRATRLASGEIQGSILIWNNSCTFAGGRAYRTVLFTLMFRNLSNGMMTLAKWARLAKGK